MSASSERPGRVEGEVNDTNARLASLAPHQPRPARDAAHALERGGVGSGQARIQEGARVRSEIRRAGWFN